MSKFKNPLVLFLAGLLFIFGAGVMLKPALLLATTLDMKMRATPNPVGSGARALGMGGAFISVADDATAASWNPAGLLQLTKPEVSLVGSWFSGSFDYNTSGLSGRGEIDEYSPDIFHLNYFSLVIPGVFLRRNIVFSFNYQHLYEFSLDEKYNWTIDNQEQQVYIQEKASKRQIGSLYALSPALAFQVNPSLFLGLTANFWPKKFIQNGWESLCIMDSEGLVGGRNMKTHSEFYERNDFSGFNMHLGFLYKFSYRSRLGRRRQFRLGGVIKTPFEADLHQERQEISLIDYSKDTVLNDYVEPREVDYLTLKMPLSYGLGASLDLDDSFSIALDCYRTHWEDYLIRSSSKKEYSPVVIRYSSKKEGYNPVVIRKSLKKEYSPINRLPEDKANITPTTQVRLGLEYLFQRPGRIIPFRAGIFYDPEPATGKPDDFYGLSLGTGISYLELYSLDFVYQYRFGRKKEAESMLDETVPAWVSQHSLNLSLIFYLF